MSKVSGECVVAGSVSRRPSLGSFSPVAGWARLTCVDDRDVAGSRDGGDVVGHVDEGAEGEHVRFDARRDVEVEEPAHVPGWEGLADVSDSFV